MDGGMSTRRLTFMIKEPTMAIEGTLVNGPLTAVQGIIAAYCSGIGHANTLHLTPDSPVYHPKSP